MKTTILRIFFCFYVSLFTALSVNAQVNKGLIVDELRCCNMLNPEGVNFPLLSWKIKTSIEGISQKAWDVEIATSKELLLKDKADVWKSGKHLSTEQFNITPKVSRLLDATTYFWRVRILDNTGKLSKWSDPAYFSIGLLSEQSWKAKWITYNYTKDGALPYFRKVFNLSREKATPTKAIVYLCGLGCSELYMNGQIVDSTRFLDPAQTNYEQYALYSTFDVTNFLQKGNNCFGVMLGKGWFTQDTGWRGAPFTYGNPMLRFQLVVYYSDGTRNVLGSDESWTWKSGPVIKTNLYLGELYDARQEVKGWCKAETPCNDWDKAILAKENMPPRLIAQSMDPIRTKQVLKAVKMWQDSTGNWIFDFGVNLAGIPHLDIQQPAGTHLSIRIAEEKKPNGSLDFASLGWIHHGKIPTDEYICKGEGNEQWSPRFTYHGFRYAELSGMIEKPDLSTMSLIVVHSDMANTGVFECANTQINKLHELAMRTVLSNLHGIPTDCPDREKCGWLGDSHAYVKMANLNLQMNNFWMKYLGDIRSGANAVEKKTLFHERFNSKFYFTDKPAGLPYMIAPGKRLCGVASPDWGTALVQLPWWLYVYYGNKDLLKDYYSNMKYWTDYVSGLAQDTARTNKYGKTTKHIVYQGLGDWCPPGGNKNIDTPIEFTSTAFHYQDVSIMERVAHLLGKEVDAKKYATEKQLIAEEVVANLYDAQHKTFGSQTADAMALDFGLVPKGDEKAVSDAMVRNMNEKYKGFMNCGIFGITRIGSMLARNGNSQAAWKMFTKKGENSFEWMWSSADVTSLWEVLPTNTVSMKAAATGSLNHPMQAGYDVCFYEDIAGIRPDASGYGFKVIRFEPLFTSNLQWAKASIESPYGTVASSWKKDADKLNWMITIPANSTGNVALPKGENITVNGVKLNVKKYAPVNSNSETTLYHFPSGNFYIQTW
ncbi:MAG TPA: family 78 glycoside hydrolase catalytic domain [Bacteroidales bacterium]